jgi:glycosyltransferase involved in cell wall biosynthesis
MDISVIVPLYNEEESLTELYDWVERVMIANGFSFEVIFINDGSTDGSWDVIKRLQSEHQDSVHAIRFRRNYGKSPALFCGFAKAEGDVVITMDADLQDSPDEIPELYRMIKDEGYDLVSGWKKKRYDNALTKNIPSKIYNATARKVTGINLHDMNCGLKAYKNEVVKNVEVYGEMHRYIPYLAKNVGFDKIGEKVVAHKKRQYGVSKFGLERFIHGYLDLFSLYFLNKFGKKPMHFFGLWGTIMFLVGLVAIMIVGGIKIVALVKGVPAPLVTNTPYFYIALTMMIIGTQMFLSGFVGELVSRSNTDRNKYHIAEEI